MLWGDKRLTTNSIKTKKKNDVRKLMITTAVIFVCDCVVCLEINFYEMLLLIIIVCNFSAAFKGEEYKAYL